MRPGDIAAGCGRQGPRWVGDPVDVVTGANVFSEKDFDVPGPVKLQWRRNYDHRRAGQDRGFGPGFRHTLDQWLCHDVDGLTFIGAEGEEVRFSFLDIDGTSVVAAGFRLTRVHEGEYELARHAQPTRVFRRVASREWPVAELRQNDGAVRVARHPSGNVESVWIDEDRALRFSYDAQDHIERIRLHDRRNQEPIDLARYRYDGRRLTGVKDVYRQTIHYEYDALDRMVRHQDTSGFAFLFEYDGQNRCCSSAGEDGLLSVTLTFRPEAFETELLDANGATWLYEYDQYESLLRIEGPSGSATVFERDRSGALVAEVDGAGRRTELIRDAAGAQVAKRLPDGTIVSLPHPRGEPERAPHRVPGTAMEWEHGDLGDPDQGLPDAHELRGVVPTAVHAALVTSEHPLRGKVEEKRNEAGLLTREVLEDGRKRRYGYTARGKVRRFRDFDGSDYKLETTSWDLPHLLTDPNGNTTRFTYSQTAEMQEVVDPAGNTVHYGYDLEDRLSTITRDTQLHDRYEHDASGNLTAKFDGEGRQLLELEYDGQNRLVRRELIGSDEHQFEYDDRGRVTGAKTHYHDTRIARDVFGSRLKDERDGEGVRHRFAAEALVSTTVLGRFRSEYHSVDGGRTTVVVDPSGGTHRIRRHGRGVFTRDYDNGWSETSQYSPRGFCLTKLAYATDKPDAAWVRRYEYSGEGDLTKVLDTDKGVTQHHHDAAHRLSATVHPDGTQDTYRYSKSGSLLEKPGLAETTVGALNQLRYADRHRFEYGVRQHVDKHTTPDGHELDYRYDARDQLVAVLWNGKPYFSAKYDAIGRRIEKNVQGRVTTYWWDGDRLAAERLPDGKLRVYVYPDAFAMVPMLFVEYASVDADPSSGERYYFFCDQRGCPERVVAQDGSVVWEAHVEAYGTAHVRTGQDFYQPFRFPGHWWDGELGLHYNRFRYYSPWLGRYLQVDPIGEGGGWNVYAYTGRPLSLVDVRGLDDCGPTADNRGDGEDRPDRQRRGPAQVVSDAFRAGWDRIFGRPAATRTELPNGLVRLEDAAPPGTRLSDGSEMPEGTRRVRYLDEGGREQGVFYQDAEGRTIRSEVNLDSPAARDKQGVSHVTPEGMDSDDHRGHMAPERHAEDQRVANVPENVLPEHSGSNLSGKKRWENDLPGVQEEHEGSELRTIHEPVYDGDSPRPTHTRHGVEVDGTRDSRHDSGPIPNDQSASGEQYPFPEI